MEMNWTRLNNSLESSNYETRRIIVEREITIILAEPVKDQNTAWNIVAKTIATGDHSRADQDETRIAKELKESPVFMTEKKTQS